MNEPQAKLTGQIVAKCWADDAYKARLLAEPEKVLAEEGLSLPAGVRCQVVENTPVVLHLVLPAKPAEGELTDESLNGVAGGTYYCCLSGCIGY